MDCGCLCLQGEGAEEGGQDHDTVSEKGGVVQVGKYFSG